MTYQYNPACDCDWCRNGGKPIGGYWSRHIHTGDRVWQSNDCYGNPHRPASRSPWTLVGESPQSISTPGAV